MADLNPTTETPPLSAVPSAVASAVATPQSLPPMDNEEREKSIKVSLADLTAKATALYAQKNFEEAAEAFATAAEQQAELNGEMDPENADILFLYGRSLFKVGQSKSDVLGGKAPTEDNKKKQPKQAKPKKSQPESSSATEAISKEPVAAVAEKAGAAKETEASTEANKPLFQFTGDENWDDSEDEEGAGDDAEEEEEEEEDDDLAVAFEILDLSRVLFEKSLQQKEQEGSEGKGKETAEGDGPILRHVKERLADTHDLLAEISLENEKYPEAIRDCRASLTYKQGLYPQESELIAEAHFKLSLALEFSSVTTSSEEGADAGGPKAVDQELRDEAAAELEKAIDSTKLKLKNKEVELAMIHAPEDNEETRKQISDVKEIIADMEQRLVDLRKPPMDVDSMLAGENPMSGLLGAALGQSSAETQARVDEAKKSANDLSGLIRKKAKPAASEEEKPADATNGNGKRKAEEEEEGGSVGQKKPKVEETAETS